MRVLSVLGAFLCSILLWFNMYNDTVYNGDITRELSIEGFVSFFDNSNNDDFKDLINIGKKAASWLEYRIPEPDENSNFFIKGLVSFANTAINVIELPLKVLCQVLVIFGYLIKIVIYFLNPFVSYF